MNTQRKEERKKYNKKGEGVRERERERGKSGHDKFNWSNFIGLFIRDARVGTSRRRSRM